MTRRTYSEELRRSALEVLEHDGLAEAAHATGVPKSTLRGWAAAAGIRTCGSEQTRAATEQKAADLEQRRADLAEALYGEAEKALRDLDAEVAVYRFGAEGVESGTAPRPNPRDRQAGIVGLAVLLDKALLLDGQATERVDTAPGVDLEAAVVEARAEKLELAELRRRLRAVDDTAT
jgi:transposase-like protein